MKVTIRHWLYGLGSALITGITSSVSSALGIVGAEKIGIDVPTLTFRQMGIIAIFGGIVGAISYLRQSPLPPETDVLIKVNPAAATTTEPPEAK